MTVRALGLCASLMIACSACAESGAGDPDPGKRSPTGRVAQTGPIPSEPRGPVQGRGDNLVLIIVDTLRADKLGSYGFPLETSPEIDALADRGTRFERVIAQCSWTRPSIGSMLTGRYPRTLGLYRGREEMLAPEFETLAEVLRESGYATIGITANPQIAGRVGFDQGFDLYIDTPRHLPVRPRRTKIPEPWRLGDSQRRLTPFNRMPSAEVFDSALEVVARVRKAPFFALINVMEVHGKGPAVRSEFDSHFADHPDGEYLRSVRQISHDIGRFLERLLERPELGKTLVVIASDHGEGLRDHPGIQDGHRHGFVLYESQVHVPLILLHSDGVIEPAVVGAPVRLVDLMPTVLDFLGIAPPPEVVGVSLLPLLDDAEADVGLPDRFVTETYRPKAAKIGVYATGWKYFENRDGWPLLGERELQAMGRREVGLFTDRIDLEPEIGWELEAYLETWEREHPKTEPFYGDHRLPQGLMQRLKHLGYVGDEDGGQDERPGAP